MTQGDKRPEPFRKGQRLTAAGLNELTTAIESVMARMLGNQSGNRWTSAANWMAI